MCVCAVWGVRAFCCSGVAARARLRTTICIVRCTHGLRAPIERLLTACVCGKSQFVRFYFYFVCTRSCKRHYSLCCACERCVCVYACAWVNRVSNHKTHTECWAGWTTEPQPPPPRERELIYTSCSHKRVVNRAPSTRARVVCLLAAVRAVCVEPALIPRSRGIGGALVHVFACNSFVVCTRTTPTCIWAISITSKSVWIITCVECIVIMIMYHVLPQRHVHTCL